MTQAELDQLITSRIAAALEAEEARRNAERQSEDQTENSERSETPHSTRFSPRHITPLIFPGVDIKSQTSYYMRTTTI